MDIREFAAQYKLRTRTDVCGDTIIAGKKHRNADAQSDIFEGYDDGALGVSLLFGSKSKWTRVRQTLEAAGFRLRQNGETEGVLTFDPTDAKQARLAIKTTGVRVKRQLSEETKAKLVARLALARRTSVLA